MKLLPLAGVLPFVIGAGLLAFDVTALPWHSAVQSLVLAYGLAIVSFMAGVHWGQYVSGHPSPFLLVASNSITLAAWVSYAFATPAHFAIVLIALFCLLLLIDYRLATSNTISRNYFRTRAIVTALVSISLAVIAKNAV